MSGMWVWTDRKGPMITENMSNIKSLNVKMWGITHTFPMHPSSVWKKKNRSPKQGAAVQIQLKWQLKEKSNLSNQWKFP